MTPLHASSTASSWRCDAIWNGVDFTPCFCERYLENLPLLYIVLTLIYIVSVHVPLILRRLRRSSSSTTSAPTPSPYSDISTTALTSPYGDPALTTLESSVILRSFAANLLPPAEAGANSSTEKSLTEEDAREVVGDFRKVEGLGLGSGRMKGWDRVHRVVGVIGGVTWFGVALGWCIAERQWKEVAFPAFIAILSFMPNAPLQALLTWHIPLSLLKLRTTLIDPQAPVAGIVPGLIELAYWCALISIPYGERMSRLLQGGMSRGGGSFGSFGARLPRHVEEPTSTFSRSTYTFLIPLLVKHWFTPIKLEDIPAMREDDGATSSLAAFRADQARRDKLYADKHDGAKRQRNLGLDLLLFFSPEILSQCIWATIFICLQYLPPTGLRLLLKYISERETSQQPLHVAWLYVAMMAGGQCVGVVAMGQSLFVGRRLCIRLRAIIVAEVFAKALRRRDVAGNTKKDNAQPARPDSEVKKGNKKASSPPPAAEADSASEGKIANLVSVDAFTISEICAYIFYIWSCPFAVLINSVLLYNTLGPASFAGIAVLVLLIPLQTLIGRLYTIIQRKFMTAVDARLEAVTEVIGHIKLIKFNAWEDKFFERMGEARAKELGVLRQRFGVNVMFNMVIWGTPVLVTAAAFAVHSLVLHQPLTADRAFASLVLFNMLRDPLALFQDTLTRLLQAYTSCGRIQAYLDEPETEKYQQISVAAPGETSIGFKNAVIGYSGDGDKDKGQSGEEYEPFRLGELDLSFPEGQLSVVTGPVGSGKTTLIASLLGEATLLRGKIFMPSLHANREDCPVDPQTGLSDTVAYCAQTPWLIGASIKDNILFGSVYDARRYDAVIEACALRRDLEIFDQGDETEVGEKGTTCSGGQKARIALARALYSPARTVILDDVLSAVDAQTARHLHLHCLLGPLMRGRTVILVSHAVNLVCPSAAYAVVLDQGLVLGAGTPSELITSGALDLGADDDTGEGTSDSAPSSSTLTPPPDSPQDIIEENLDGVAGDALDTKKQVEKDKAAEVDSATPTKGKQLVSAETQGQGSVGLATYLLYFKSMGSMPYWVVSATAFFGSQILQVATNAWIRDWASANDQQESFTSWRGRVRRDLVERTMTGHSMQYYLGVYCAISAVYLFLVATRVSWNYYGSLSASRRLFDGLLRRILGAKMRFFDSTPSGRIMNRLSKDMSSIDTETAEILQYFAQCVLSVVAVLLVVTFSTPLFLLALVVIGVLYWLVGSLYVTTSREIKRYDSVTRSPLFVSFSEVLVGMSTIRSYGDSARFMRKIFHELDQNTRCFWYLWQANRVLNNFSNFVGSLVTIFACLFALQSKTMDAGAVGLSITYALSFTEYVLWVVRLYAASEMSMNSVERVAEYLDLEIEEEANQRGIEPPAYWPTKDGSVVVEDLTCRYAPQLELVLNKVSFTIGPKEKIGICGRTGSGKSTLALSFFRFLHQEGGRIIIDGLDISKLSLTSLRSRLTILPQEAQLFSGTIRDNLDPFAQHEDFEIWEALAKCGLSGKTPGGSRNPSRVGSRLDLTAAKNASAKDLKAQSISNLRAQAFKKEAARRGEELGESATGDDGEGEFEERVVIRSLEEKVAVGGKNFSQGQRQLLALARGLLKLRTSSFLIMDESTANLDHATDATIQNVLRTGLADTQMLVIAHRLLTVVGLDKILVLDHGKVVEFGTPWELMQKDEGMFRELVRQSGEEAQLIEMAKLVHEERTK